MKKILLTFLLAVLLVPGIAQAQVTVGSGLLDNARQEAGFAEANETTLAANIGGFVQIAMSFIGIIFTILIVYAGFLWMTARGNEDQVTKARKTMTGAVIGLVLAVGAYSITSFIVPRIIDRTSGGTGSGSSGGSAEPVCCEIKSGCGFFSCDSTAYSFINAGECQDTNPVLCADSATCDTRVVSDSNCPR